MAERPSLILLPGLLCDERLWQHQIAGLGPRAAVGVALPTGSDDLGALADAVLARAPRRFALAGLSMGGYVALEVLRRAPDRVERLALLDTTARPDTPEQTDRRRRLMALAGSGRFADVIPFLLPNLIHPDRLADAALTGLVRDMAARIGAEAFIRQQTAIIGRPDSRPDLPRIACPTLVLCGRQDALTPLDLHREMAGAIPGAVLEIVEDSGHLAPLERPETVTARLAAWLDVG